MTTTLKVKNGVIRLPRQLQRNWSGAEVLVRATNDTVVLKRLRPARFWDTWKALKPLARKTTQRDINAAIRWARQRKNK